MLNVTSNFFDDVVSDGWAAVDSQGHIERYRQQIEGRRETVTVNLEAAGVEVESREETHDRIACVDDGCALGMRSLGSLRL